MLVAQSCPTLWDSMDCSPPGSSVQGIFQARILEWIAIHFSRGSSRLWDRTQASLIAGRFFFFFNHLSRQGSPIYPQRRNLISFAKWQPNRASVCLSESVILLSSTYSLSTYPICSIMGVHWWTKVGPGNGKFTWWAGTQQTSRRGRGGLWWCF